MQEDETQAHPSQSRGELPEGIKHFGHYTLIKELGRGAQGVVYLAEDSKLSRNVALKMLAGASTQPLTVRERFQREAEATSKLDHPGICKVYEMGEEEGVPYIAMQYVRGTPLADIIQKSRLSRGSGSSQDIAASLTGEFREKEESPEAASDAPTQVRQSSKGELSDVVRLIERAAKALHVAHEAGLIHRDIKPGNIMVTPEGDPVILDFGLARDLEQEGHTLTQSGQLLGTPAYMAAEQVTGDRALIDRRADVYALGVTLYECLTLERPFDGATWQQLFQKIRTGVPRKPRRLNPRIPQDLATVIEVAMERELPRRYQTAQDLAEDLRRVRAYEPIRAKAAGPISRIRKWSKRKPAEAVGAAAVVLFSLVGAGYLGWQRIQSENADLATAAASRQDALAKSREYGGLKQQIDAFHLRLATERSTSFDAYAPTTLRAEYARTELELQRLEVEAESLVEAARQDLSRARRLEAQWGVVSPETEEAHADLFFTLWREAVRSGDPIKEPSLRSSVVLHDTEGRYEKDLVGRGTLAIAVAPDDAEIFLFRYEPYEMVRPTNPVPRLVPVPTSGVGQVREGEWSDGFYPGDLCLEITSVEPGSPAAEHGLRRGDFVIRLNGAPCGDGVFLTRSEGPLFEAGGVPLTRIHTVNGVEVETFRDLRMLPRKEGSTLHDVVLANGVEVPVDLTREQPGVSSTLVRVPAVADMELVCLRSGEPVTVDVPAGVPSGIRSRSTAYPLICSRENRVFAGDAIDADPGSYLLLVRRDGFEDQRYPLVVPRGGDVRVDVTLRREGTTPPGYVYIPPGPFISGADPRALGAAAEEIVDVAAFVIGKEEVSNREYFEFVNDPQISAAIDAKLEAGQALDYLPRESLDLARLSARKNNQGVWEPTLGGPTTPVSGITWHDVQAYLAWRNAKAEASGEPWIYDLPTRREWEKAARGVDGRAFPWGDRFDFSLTVSLHRKWSLLFGWAGGYEPRDQSPYGLLDMGGHRQEWTGDRYGDSPPEYHAPGGAWSFGTPDAFRSASRSHAFEDYLSAGLGFRLVLRPRD